jgi:hypothetical protein
MEPPGYLIAIRHSGAPIATLFRFSKEHIMMYVNIMADSLRDD